MSTAPARFRVFISGDSPGGFLRRLKDKWSGSPKRLEEFSDQIVRGYMPDDHEDGSGDSSLDVAAIGELGAAMRAFAGDIRCIVAFVESESGKASVSIATDGRLLGTFEINADAIKSRTLQKAQEALTILKDVMKDFR